MALLFCTYIAFDFSTRPSSFGLTLDPNGHTTWLFTRLLTFSFWLGLAAVLLGVRRSPVAWRSSAYAFLATSVLAVVIAPSFVPASASHASVAVSIGMYASVSGLVCITIAHPLWAVGLGALLLPAQLVLDATAHVLSGQVRLH